MYSEEDIIALKPDTFHGHYPFTQQSEGCGQKGDFISISHTFLSGRNITELNAAKFAHIGAIPVWDK